MAASIYPQEPGSEYGPCKEPCEHVDCARSRRDAAQVCPICEQPIGYGHRTYMSASERNENQEELLVHAVCLERQVEQERANRKR